MRKNLRQSLHQRRARVNGKAQNQRNLYSKTIVNAYDKVRHIPLNEAYSLVQEQGGLSFMGLKNAVDNGEIHVYSFNGGKYLDRLDIGRVFHVPIQSRRGLTIERFFSGQGKNPLDEDYETKHLEIKDVKGKTIYKINAEFPRSWDSVSAQIVAQKYFLNPERKEWRKKLQEKLGVPQENSIRHLITRVSNFFADKGLELGYFSTQEDRNAFRDELMALQIQRKIAFNSPVQFNAGIYNEYGIKGSNNVNWVRDPKTGELKRLRDAEYVHPQCHACFIKGPRDDLESILKHVADEGAVFAAGSGIGQNIGDLREAGAALSGGGKSSGAMSFLKIYDYGAGTIKSGGKSRRAARMTMMDQNHPDIMEFIKSKVGEDHKALILMKEGYTPGMDGEAYTTVTLQNTNITVRLDGHFFEQLEKDGEIELISVKEGRVIGKVSAKRMMEEIAFGSWRVGDPAVMYTETIDRMHTAPNSGRQRATNPCGEYMFLNDTSCNLASSNLAAFSDEKGNFFVESFKKANRILAIAQDIANDCASYPVRDIAEISPEFRTIGTGFAGLGSLLMRKGIPYDSDKARALAGAITAIMTGSVYEASAEMAKKLGTFTHFEFNRKPMMEVIKRHKKSLDDVLWSEIDDPQLKEQAYGIWERVAHKGEANGFRNAQATVIAPTGTISFLMGTQDSTGIEPPASLIIGKDLAGGGRIEIANSEISNSLKNLGYDEQKIKQITDYIAEKTGSGTNRNTVIGAPHLSPDHYDIFSTAFGNRFGEGSIGIKGHVGMMGAVQPFISGGISKTNNLPESATVKDIYDTFMLGHDLGLKGVAVFRNNSKPVSAINFGGNEHKSIKRGEKEDLPDLRIAYETEVKINGTPIHLIVSEYPDGKPGQLVFASYKSGSTMKALLENAGIDASTMLKGGIPLERIVRKWRGQTFDPHGLVTGHPYIKTANSPLDYAAKFLALEYMGRTEEADDSENLKLEELRGFRNGAFMTYLRQKVNPWNVDQVLEDPILGGFEKFGEGDLASLLLKANGQEKHNNLRGVICQKCGNIMDQYKPNCYMCRFCGENMGGCGM
ncbi:MAG: vitamin B12-dependent ribonucleotide reductase [Nanoarchaeota archaeon]